MKLTRWFKHLLAPPWLASHRFGMALSAEIGAAVMLAEAGQPGELRFVAEGPLPFGYLWHERNARQRAADLFAQLGVWDTAENTGVLLYVQLVDHRVEIFADRGIAAKVPQAEWEAICHSMETAFKEADFRGGALNAVSRVGALLRTHFPGAADTPNELANQAVIL